MLVDAENKAGYPPRNLAHAKTILSDYVWVFTPCGRAKSLGRHDIEPPAFKPWAAFHYWRPSGQPRGLSPLARVASARPADFLIGRGRCNVLVPLNSLR